MFVLAIALGACAAEAPPLDDLPLRDALGADPEVIASLSADARRSLAERFEDARRGADEREEVQPSAHATPAAEVRDADRAREARGDDALVVATIAPDKGSFAVRAIRIGDADASRAIPTLEGPPPSSATAEAEARALRGRAGAIVAALAERSSATHAVRATGWPAGAVAVGDAVYVNPSWLVVMAALDDEGARATATPPLAVAPPMQPLSVKGNPYVTYASLEACTSDVDSRCKECLSTGNCEDKPALADFSNAKDECTFLGADPARPAELCALVLLSVDLIAECVRTENPSCSLPTGSRSADLVSASTFLASTICVQALDLCLGGNATPPTSGGGSSIPASHCQDPFSACASSCKSISDSCKTDSCSGTKSGSSCTSCNNTGNSSSCSSCGGSSSGSSCGGGSGSNCNKCETAPAPAFPFAPVAWLLAPLAYVFTRPRRRS